MRIWNSAERLLACLRGEVPDRIPISTYELVGWNSRAWENNEPSYTRLMEFIRQNTDCMYLSSEPVANALAGQHKVSRKHWDEGDQHVTETIYHISNGRLSSINSQSDKVKTVWHRERPCKNLQDMEAYLNLPWAPGDPDFSNLERAWAELDGTRGLPVITLSDPLCEAAELFRLQDFLVYAMTETEGIVKALDQLHERYLESLRRILRGPVKNALFRICGPEYAAPPFLPPSLFAKFVSPYDGQYIQMIKEAGAWPRLHIHGKIAGVLAEVQKMAPDAIDPIEPPPDGDIDVATLKRTIGGQICLMGGIELKHLDARDGEFVEQLVRELILAGKPGGRFVIMPTAAPINIPVSAKTEANYFRWIEVALKAGQY